MLGCCSFFAPCPGIHGLVSLGTQSLTPLGCLWAILLAGCSTYFEVPMATPGGTNAVGVGGFLTANGFGSGFRMSVQAAPWTLATALLTGVTTYNAMIPPANRTTTNTSAGARV